MCKSEQFTWGEGKRLKFEKFQNNIKFILKTICSNKRRIKFECTEVV